MQTLINTYMVGNPPEVKAQISKWERELNDSITNQEIEVEEWKNMVKDPGNNRGCYMLFRQTIQQYWVMKNILAQAMTFYKKREEQEEARPMEPSMKDLHKEISIVQIQLYLNNLVVNRIEQRIQDMKRSSRGLVQKP